MVSITGTPDTHVARIRRKQLAFHSARAAELNAGRRVVSSDLEHFHCASDLDFAVL